MFGKLHLANHISPLYVFINQVVLEHNLVHLLGFPGGSEVKASACSVGDPGSIPGWGRSPGEENGNPLQYFCLENPMDGEAWWATVHGVAKSRIRLSDFTFFLSLFIGQHIFYGCFRTHNSDRTEELPLTKWCAKPDVLLFGPL